MSDLMNANQIFCLSILKRQSESHGGVGEETRGLAIWEPR